MTGQVEIPVDETGPERGPCGWCGQDTRLTITLEEARYGTDKRTGVRVCKKPRKWEWICERHQASVRTVYRGGDS